MSHHTTPRALLARFYPEVQVIALPQNRGLAVAVNAAFDATGGEYVVLLNNDTEVHPRWLEQLIGALDRYPAYSFAASKLLSLVSRAIKGSAAAGLNCTLALAVTPSLPVAISWMIYGAPGGVMSADLP